MAEVKGKVVSSSHRQLGHDVGAFYRQTEQQQQRGSGQLARRGEVQNTCWGAAVV